MSTEVLEREIADLKRRLENLEAKISPVAKPTWREAAGSMKDCDLLEEAAQYGAEWKARANAEGR